MAGKPFSEDEQGRILDENGEPLKDNEEAVKLQEQEQKEWEAKASDLEKKVLELSQKELGETDKEGNNSLALKAQKEEEESFKAQQEAGKGTPDGGGDKPEERLSVASPGAASMAAAKGSIDKDKKAAESEKDSK